MCARCWCYPVARSCRRRACGLIGGHDDCSMLDGMFPDSTVAPYRCLPRSGATPFALIKVNSLTGDNR